MKPFNLVPFLVSYISLGSLLVLTKSSNLDFDLGLIRKAFFDAGVVPRDYLVQDFEPVAAMELVFQPVNYAPVTLVSPGQKVPQLVASEEPEIFLKVNPMNRGFSSEEGFTLFIIDLDSNDTQYGLFQEMLAIDVQLFPTSESDKLSLKLKTTKSTYPYKQVFPYLPLLPGQGTGFHRYVCFLFQGQPSPISLTGFITSSDRTYLNLANFVDSNGLGKPIAGTFFLTRNSADEPKGP